MNPTYAPILVAFLQNAPSTNIPAKTPSTSPIKLLNHSYADFISPFANTIATAIESIPTPNDIYCAILVCFSILISFVMIVCISKVQLVATELSPVDKVD